MKLHIQRPANTPLIHAEGLFGIKNLFIKDETKCPTHTFKDRMAYEMISPLIQSLESRRTPEKVTFGCISYGNMAISMGHYVNLLNKRAHRKIAKAVVFVPHNLRKRRFGPDTEGREVNGKQVLKKVRNMCSVMTVIKLDLEKKRYMTEDLKEIAKRGGVLDGEFVDVTEGLGRPAYEHILSEAVEKLGRAPDYIFVQFGAGVLCNETINLVRRKWYKTKVVPVSVGRKDSIASMLYGPYWVDVKALERDGQAQSKHETHPCTVYNLRDEEIVQSMRTIAERVTAEPSGAAGFAILHRLNEIHPEFDPAKDFVLVINTGNGLLNF